MKETKLEWIDEYHKDVRYGLKANILIDEKSQFQQITVIESNRYGKALLLDGCWMTSEKQEKSYHECLVHPALTSAESISKVLVIGGGDGGTIRECLKHKDVKKLDMVEIDKRVIEISQKYLPSLGENSWKDKRLNLKIIDGISWVQNSPQNHYDVIIIDGSDPKGPAKGLFNRKFFEHCKRILKKGGVFATQSESPEAFEEIHLDIIKTLRSVFKYADPMYGSVPIYPSGWWSWTFACTDTPRYLTPMKKRIEYLEKQTKIWTPKWQKGAFQCIPAFIENKLN